VYIVRRKQKKQTERRNTHTRLAWLLFLFLLRHISIVFIVIVSFSDAAEKEYPRKPCYRKENCTMPL